MRNLWNESIPFPSFEELETVQGAKYLSVHTACENGYHFSLGAAVIKHKGVLRVSFANSWRQENDDKTVLAKKCLLGDSTVWQDGVIAKNANGYGRSHGVYFEKDGELFVFCPRARFDRVDRYPELQIRGIPLERKGRVCLLGHRS